MNPFNLVGLIFVGLSLLWTVKLIYGRRPASANDLMRRAITTTGWVLLLAGIFGSLLAAPGPLSVPLLPLAAIVFLMAMVRFRQSERRGLAAVLEIATVRQIPLPSAVRAYAGDCSDEQGMRAIRLANTLEEGVPLHSALIVSRNSMPRDVDAAITYGEATGELGPALRAVLSTSLEDQSRGQSLLEKLAYFSAVLLTCVCLMSYMVIYVIPMFDRVFASFGLAIPPLTAVLISVSEKSTALWIGCLLLTPFLLLCVVIATLSYIGRLPTNLPLLGRLTLRANLVTLLRLLALSIERQRPLLNTLHLFAQSYPHGLLRSRLSQVVRRMNDGQDWCDSLRDARLIRSGEAALLKSAQRVGNLPWALNETADRLLRQLNFRGAAILNILFPLVLVTFGLIAGLLIVGMYMPLVDLLSKLSAT